MNGGEAICYHGGKQARPDLPRGTGCDPAARWWRHVMAMRQPVGFGEVLRRYRVAAGLTQEALAERAGLSARGISDLERGLKHTPRKETVQALAHALSLVGADRAALEAAARRLDERSSSVPPGGGRPRQGAALPPLVGRARELALLERHLAGEGPPMLVLAGEPGIGKTRLLREVAQMAAWQGWRVLEGGCQRRGEQEPYAPLVEALAGQVGRRSPAQLRADLQGCAWLARLLPELVEMVAAPLPLWTLSAAQERRLMFGSVRRYLANVAGPAGTLLALDDVQWAASDALDLLGDLVRTAANTPLRVVGAYRDTEVGPDHPLSALLADLAHAQLATRHMLGPLAAAEGGELLDRLLEGVEGAETTVRQRVLQRAGGVPFFLVTCAQALRTGVLEGASEESVPWDVAQGIRQRVAALSRAARDVLGAAAVVGRVVRLRLLSSVVACPEGELLSAVEAICRARLLLESEQGYLFPHDVIREVVETDLSAARRAALHRHVAEALEREPGEPPVALLAYHYGRGEDHDRAIEYLIRAAEHARHGAAHREEVIFLAQAIALAQRLGRRELAVDLRIKRGRAFQSAELWREARADLEAALAELAPESVEQHAQVRVFLAQVCFWLCDTPGTRRYATESLAMAEQAGRDDLAAQAMAWLAEAVKSDGDHRAALELHTRAMARSSEPCLPALANAPLSLYWLGRNDEAVTLARQGIDAARHANDAAATMIVMPHLGLALAARGRYDEAMRVFEEARQFGRTYELRSLLARAISMSVGLHLDVYDLDGAEALAREGLDLSRSVAWAPSEVCSGIDLLLTFVRRQEIGRAEQLLAGVVDAAENLSSWHGWHWQLYLAHARAELAMARGEWEAALCWAGDTIACGRAARRVKYQVGGLRARAQALAALGRTHDAVADLRRAVALARPAGDPALFVRVSGTLLAIDGDDALAAEAHVATARIVAALPEPAMRRRFEAAAPLHIARP